MQGHLSTFKSLRILYSYRTRVLEGVLHDVGQRYTGSVLGSFWAVLYPMLNLGIYAVLYAFIFKVRPSGLTEMQYTLLIFSGMVPLMAFSEALSASTSSLSAHKNLLLSTVFPAELLPPRSALAAHATSLVGLGLTLALGVALGRTGWKAALLVPVFWMLLLMFVIGIGWITSLLSLVARDIQHGLGLIIMLLFVLSPFAYTPEMVPSSLKIVIYLNPLSYFVLSFQQLICYDAWPGVIPATGAIILAFSSFFLGFSIFRRAKHVFFDYA